MRDELLTDDKRCRRNRDTPNWTVVLPAAKNDRGKYMECISIP